MKNFKYILFALSFAIVLASCSESKTNSSHSKPSNNSDTTKVTDDYAGQTVNGMPAEVSGDYGMSF